MSMLLGLLMSLVLWLLLPLNAHMPVLHSCCPPRSQRAFRPSGSLSAWCVHNAIIRLTLGIKAAPHGLAAPWPANMMSLWRWGVRTRALLGKLVLEWRL